MNEMNARDYEQKTCEACSKTFGCGAKLDGCWCTEIDVSPEVADDLKTNFQDCICPKCLADIDPATKQTSTSRFTRFSCL